MTRITRRQRLILEGGHFLCDDWLILETGVRGRIRGFIEELLEAELDLAWAHRYERRGKGGAAF